MCWFIRWWRTTTPSPPLPSIPTDSISSPAAMMPQFGMTRRHLAYHIFAFFHTFLSQIVACGGSSRAPASKRWPHTVPSSTKLCTQRHSIPTKEPDNHKHKYGIPILIKVLSRDIYSAELKFIESRCLKWPIKMFYVIPKLALWLANLNNTKHRFDH